MILYAEFVRGRDGNPLRILITEGDEVVEAKHGGNLPRYIPLPKEGGAALVARAFKGEDVGLKPGSFKTGKETSEQGGKLIQKEASAAAVAALKTAGKKARQFGSKA